MIKEFKNDVFEPEISFAFEEASGDVNGTGILGKIKGKFFVPNGKSRNKRYYSESVWDKQLSKPNIMEMIKDRRMIGTISHEQPLDDLAVLEGKVSHVTTVLETKNKENGIDGYGEALILDTPAGKILNTFSRAGIKLYTSSRAKGKFKGQHEGMPAVDPDQFFLRGFDFVLDPGFIEAQPELVEGLSDEAVSDLKESIDKLRDISIKDSSTNGGANKEGDDDMGEKNNQELLESAYKENGVMKSDLTAALNENEDLKSKNVELNETVVSLEESKTQLAAATELAEKYKALGTPEEITEAIDVAEQQRKAYEPLGTPEDIEIALDMGKELVENYVPLGTPEEVDEALELAKESKAKYEDLGTPEEIEEAFGLTEEYMGQQDDVKNTEVIKELAEELGVSEEAITEVYKDDADKVRKFFSDLSETAKFRDKFRKKDDKKNLDEGKETDGDKKKSLFAQTDGEHLMEALS